MKHIEVIKLRDSLSQVKDLNGFEVNYAIEENLSRAQASLNPLQKQEESLHSLLEDYYNEKTAIQVKYATVDGQVKTEKRDSALVYIMPESLLPSFDKEIVELDKKHKPSIDKYETELEKFNSFLKDSDSSFIIFTVKKDAVPRDISRENMKLIFSIIEKG